MAASRAECKSKQAAAAAEAEEEESSRLGFGGAPSFWLVLSEP